MFHTFDIAGGSSAKSESPRQGEQKREQMSRRGTTLQACTSCRHRKIKCDGERPCEACCWYRKQDQCCYVDPRPSRSHIEQLLTTLEEYKNTLNRIFPSVPLETVINLSREELLSLATSSQPHAETQNSVSPVTSSVIDMDTSQPSTEENAFENAQEIFIEPLQDHRDITESNVKSFVDFDESGEPLWHHVHQYDGNSWLGIDIGHWMDSANLFLQG